MKSIWFKIGTYFLKLGITGLILYLIFSRFDIRMVFSKIISLPYWVLFFMIISTVYKHFTQYKNWKYSLQMNPGYIKKRTQVLSSYLIGIPLRFLIPGGTATYGKMFFVDNTSKLASIVAVSSEKFFMTWMTYTFAVWAGALYFEMFSPWLRLALGIVVSLVPLGLYFALGWHQRSKKVQALYAAFAPKIAIFQVSYVFTTVLQIYIIINAMGRISFVDAATKIPLVNFANAIPITISGLGLREYFAIHILEPIGISAEIAVSAMLTLFIFHDLIPALIGSVILLRTKKVNHV